MEKLITEFSIGLFFWQTVIFIFLILLLKKFAWKPILDAVNESEEGIKNALLSAEKAKEEILMGSELKSMVMNDDERKLTTNHE